MCTATAIVVGVGAAGAITSAEIQSSTAKDVAETQKSSTDKALEYAKQQDLYRNSVEANRYAALAKGMQPYSSTGGAADARLAQILGIPGPTAPQSSTNPVGPGTPPPTYPTPTVPGTPTPPSTAIPRGAPPTTAGGSGTVTMRGPDGSTQAVPQAQVSYWQSKGAQVVSGGADVSSLGPHAARGAQ